MNKNNKLKLSYIEISGYKSISSVCPLRLNFGDVNILLGANASGKSNIVSFFRMLSYMMSGSFQKYVALSGTNQIFLHYGSKMTPTISAEIKFSSEIAYDLYKFSLTHAASNRLIINSETVEWHDESRNTNPFSVEVKSDFNESGLLCSNNKIYSIIHSLLSSCKVYQFSDSSLSAPMRQASTIDSAHYLQSEANNLSSFLLYLRDNYQDSYRRIVDYVSSVIPQFGDFYLEPEKSYVSLKWTDNSPNDYVFSSEQFSDGSIRFIALATLLLQPEETMPKVIVIDEPELGLHPFAIDVLSEMIKDASLHSQIIVATQSPLLIDNFEMKDIMVIEREEDHTLARNIDQTTYAEWLKDYSISELWNKNVIGGRP